MSDKGPVSEDGPGSDDGPVFDNGPGSVEGVASEEGPGSEDGAVSDDCCGTDEGPGSSDDRRLVFGDCSCDDRRSSSNEYSDLSDSNSSIVFLNLKFSFLCQLALFSFSLFGHLFQKPVLIYCCSQDVLFLASDNLSLFLHDFPTLLLLALFLLNSPCLLFYLWLNSSY